MRRLMRRLVAAALCIAAALLLLGMGGFAAIMLFGRGEPPAVVPAAETPLGREYGRVSAEREALSNRIKAMQKSLETVDAALRSAGVSAYNADLLRREGRADEADKLTQSAAESLKQTQRQLSLQRAVMREVLKEPEVQGIPGGAAAASRAASPEPQDPGGKKEAPQLSDLFK